MEIHEVNILKRCRQPRRLNKSRVLLLKKNKTSKLDRVSHSISADAYAQPINCPFDILLDSAHALQIYIPLLNLKIYNSAHYQRTVPRLS
jgi:hypothetical protein